MNNKGRIKSDKSHFLAEGKPISPPTKSRIIVGVLLVILIEIEIREDLELPKEEALRRLNEYEKSLAIFDIGPKNRLKKSLFEMFVRK